MIKIENKAALGAVSENDIEALRPAAQAANMCTISIYKVHNICMDKISALLFVILSALIIFIFFASYCQANTINRNFNIPIKTTDFKIQTDNNGFTWIDSETLITLFDTDTTSPALPQIVINILLRPEETISDFSYDFNCDTTWKDINPVSCSPLRPNIDSPKIPINSCSFKDSIYSIGAEYIGTNLMDGYKFASFLVNPFSFQTTNKHLTLYTEFHLNLSLSTPYDEKTIATPAVLPEGTGLNMRNILTENIYNTQDISAYYQQTYPNSQTNDDYEYLIITTDWLAPTFQELADWKTQKGIKTLVLKVSDILNTYRYGSTQYRIKCALKDYYTGQHKGLKYVLLAGVPALVPSLPCDVNVIQSENSYHDTTPSDLYYACFDTMDWDANGNGIFGEVEDQIDMAPEITISRAQVNTLQEGKDFVTRVIEYEKNPKIDEWEDNILLAGCKLHWDSVSAIDSHIISDAEYYGELMQKTISPLWNGKVFRLFDTYTDHENCADYSFNPNHFQTELEKGYTFVNIDSHGAAQVFQTEQSLYDHFAAASLINKGYSIILTSACHTNMIDKLPGLSHSFMANPNSGILAYVGSSRFGWSPTSQAVHRAFLKYLFLDEYNRIGTAMTRIKSIYVPFCRTEKRSFRWIMLSTNLLGDPEMPIYITKPKKLDNVSVVYKNGVINISTGLDSCDVCIMSSQDKGASLYQVWRNINSCTLDSIFSNVSICVTKNGYIPHLIHIYPEYDIQNETLTGDVHIVSNKINIGYDVTTTKPNGDVIVEDANVVLSGSDGVIIKNNFVVKKGSSLKIN